MYIYICIISYIHIDWLIQTRCGWLCLCVVALSKGTTPLNGAWCFWKIKQWRIFRPGIERGARYCNWNRLTPHCDSGFEMFWVGNTMPHSWYRKRNVRMCCLKISTSSTPERTIFIQDKLFLLNRFVSKNDTPPKFNMEPENDGFNKESPFPGVDFQVLC